MEIKKAIHQIRPFRNDYQKAIVNLLYTHGWLMQQLRSFFTPYGLTIKQYNVLRILNGAKEAISTSIIRERMLDKMSDASRVVERLYKKGLVEKKGCPHDKRLVDVWISEQGVALLAQIDQKSESLDQILGYLNTGEVTQLNQLLDRLRG
ncbi:MAG: MarR family transcriptional regulator [Bacteroidota bacterium]